MGGPRKLTAVDVVGRNHSDKIIMTQHEAMASQHQVKQQRPWCVVVARRMTDWSGDEWWLVQVEDPRQRSIMVVTNEQEWLSLSTTT